MDTEANGFHAYEPRTCLIQVAWETGSERRCALIDPLALDGGLDPLRLAFEDPERQKILHGADNDVRLLARDCGIDLRGLIDTQLYARLLGLRRTGLQALAEQIAGVVLSKSGQRLDWARRPLPEKALRYAAQDALVLFDLADELGARLERARRLGWAEEECRLLEGMRGTRERPRTAAGLASRITGSRRLRPDQLGVLHALLLWREGLARRVDSPPVNLLSPSSLLILAKRAPEEPGDLLKAGVSPAVVRRHGPEIVAVARAAGPCKREADATEEHEARRDEPLPAGLLARLKDARRRAALRLEVEEGVICANTVLKQVARRRPRKLEELPGCGLRRWQAAELGAALLRIVASSGAPPGQAES